MGPDAMILVFLMLSFWPTFSLSSFTFIKRLFSSSSLSAIRVVNLHIWGYWYFSQQSRFQLVFLPVQRFSWCTLHISSINRVTIYSEFNSDDHYIYYCGQESLRRNGVAIIVNKRVWNSVLGCNLKNGKMTSVHFQANSFNITVIQVYALTSNVEEAEVEQFYEHL